MQHINNTPADSGLGDTLKVAFDKVNANFQELVAIDSSFSGDIQTLNTIISDGSTLNHTHTISQIIGLQTALSGKVSTSTFNTQILAINSSIQAINSTLSEIIDILNTKISDAPFSGITYGRRDGQWVQISGGTSDLSGYVPYTGGTKNLILTGNSITANGGFECTFPNGWIYAGTIYDGNTRQFDLNISGDDVSAPLANNISLKINVDEFFKLRVDDSSFTSDLAITPGQSLTTITDFTNYNAFTITPTTTSSNKEVVTNEGYIGNYVKLNTGATETSAVGKMYWNDTQGTINFGLKGGQTSIKSGVDLVVRVVNKVTPNTTLTKAAYQAVRVSGAQGQRLAIELAQANNDNNSADTIGLVCETIAPNQEGFIMTMGQLEGLNTTGSLQGETWNDGDVLYLSPTNAGRLTNIKPTGATGHIVVMGYVEYAHINNGKIYVKIMNGWELDELHNVNISGASSGQVLRYDGTNWVNSNPNIVSLNGLTASTQTFLTGTTGNNFNIVSSGTVHTFNLPSASLTNRGLLTSTDWSRFNEIDLTRKLVVSNTGSTVSGTTAETILTSLSISANTLDTICDLFITLDYNKNTGVGIPIRLYYNTTNSLVGATQISLYNTGSNRNGGFNRKFVVKGTSMDLITTVPSVSQLNNQFVDAIFGASTVITIAPTGNMFFIFTVANDAVGTIFTNKRATIEKMKLI